MPGLNLGVMGGAKISGNGNGFSPTVSPTATAGQKAFGPGYTAPGQPSGLAALWPNDATGITFTAGVIALGLLLLLRHSLPN